jgi:hypothetical protein
VIKTIRALRPRAPSSVEADARAMDHRAHVAGPPPSANASGDHGGSLGEGEWGVS